MITATSPTIPEQGQVVTVRQRPYVVSEVEASQLPISPLSPAQRPSISLPSPPFRMMPWAKRCKSSGSWSRGAKISEKVDLHDTVGFDSPQRHDAFLDAVRWGAIATADTCALQALFRSGIEIEDYQLDPLVRVEQMPRVSLLLADDVGLGKTVDVGLVVQELLVRNRARTLLIVCPARLQIHWLDQMQDKFYPDFRVVDSALMKELRRSQLSRNTAAPEAKLGQIPAEIEAEQAAIRVRYADPQPRLFPVTVTYLIMEKLA